MLKKQIEQEQHREFNKKVAIIGSGYVGAGIAYSMMIKDIAREIVLIDTKENVAKFLKSKGADVEKKFKAIQEEPAIDKDTGAAKTYKNGKPRKKGYVAALKWFKDEYKEEFVEFIK